MDILGRDARADRGHQARGGMLKPGVALVLFPQQEGKTEDSPAGYLAPLRTALIGNNGNDVVVCECDYRALRRGINNVVPGGGVQ
jgi:hypothetical protein